MPGQIQKYDTMIQDNLAHLLDTMQIGVDEYNSISKGRETKMELLTKASDSCLQDIANIKRELETLKKKIGFYHHATSEIKQAIHESVNEAVAKHMENQTNVSEQKEMVAEPIEENVRFKSVCAKTSNIENDIQQLKNELNKKLVHICCKIDNCFENIAELSFKVNNIYSRLSDVY